METSFCELKGKEVINIVDGKRLGPYGSLVIAKSVISELALEG